MTNVFRKRTVSISMNTLNFTDGINDGSVQIKALTFKIVEEFLILGCDIEHQKRLIRRNK